MKLNSEGEQLRKRRCKDDRHCSCKDELIELKQVCVPATKVLVELYAENSRLKQALSMRAVLFGGGER